MRGKRIDPAPYIDKLVQAVLVGATYELAAQYAGVSGDTFLRWRQRMETAKPGTPLAQLRERLTQAEGRAAVGWLALINKAAANDWKAASWLLSHRYPEQYGRTMQKVAVTDRDGEALQGQGLHALLRQAVIMLPSKSPSPEQWQRDVERLGYHPHSHGAGPEPRP